jgi:hypothetical protein
MLIFMGTSDLVKQPSVLKRRLGLKHAELQQHRREIVDPGLVRDFVTRKKIKKRALDLETLSGRWEPAEIAFLRSNHFQELHRLIPVNQQMFADKLYVGKGRKPPYADVLDGAAALDMPADGAFHFSIFCVVCRERREIMTPVGFVSSGKDL